MNQWKFDIDGDEGDQEEEWYEFRGNPIRAMFDHPPMNLYEKSWLDKYQPKHQVIDEQDT